MADLAQLVERRVVVPNVAGSIPVVRPKVNMQRDSNQSLFFTSFYLYD
jgi:hypothetical protein